MEERAAGRERQMSGCCRLPGLVPRTQHSLQPWCDVAGTRARLTWAGLAGLQSFTLMLRNWTGGPFSRRAPRPPEEQHTA